MAGNGIKREMVDYVPPGNQSQTPPPQYPNLDSVSVEVENSDLPISEQPLNAASLVQNKRGSFFSCLPKPLYYLIWCLLFVCLAPIAYACVTIATVVILVLLMVALVVVQLLHLCCRWKDVDTRLIFKYAVLVWISMMAILLLLEVGIFYPIAKYSPRLKLVMLLGLPIAKWITIICMFIGIHLLSQLCWGLMILLIYRTAARLDTYVFIDVIFEAPTQIIGSLLFWWAEVMVMNDVPTFKQSKILHVNTQRWIEGVLIFVIGHNLISLITHLVVLLLIKIQEDESTIGSKINNVLSHVPFNDAVSGVFIKRYAVYIADGIKSSVTFILSTVMLLLTWVLFLGDQLNTSQGKSVMQLGTRTLVTVLICSFLWLIKSCVLLYWKANVVYDRLHSKITDIGKQLYFLVLLSYPHFRKAVVKSRTTYFGSEFFKVPDSMKAPWVLLINHSIRGEISKVKCRKKARLELINHAGPEASIFALYDASRWVLEAQYALSKDSISCDLRHLQAGNSEDDNEDISDILKKILQPEWECNTLKGDWKSLLHQVLGDVQTSEEISFLKVKTWMERAHDRCRFLANTLISEKEVAKCLNQILSGIIILVTFITWLLLTELATTKILVLVASPLLAGTFIFGETCKTLFQGLIFVYIVHPVGVGDLCVIDGKLLEVKRIGVWSTIFSEVRAIGKREDIIFPNSELAVKNIINCKTEFDWKDYIEFSLCSNKDLETTQNIILQIESYLDTEKERFTPNFHSVEFLEIGEKYKIGIHVKYNARTKDWTYFECLKEKERRRLKFSLYLCNLLNQMESQK